MTNPIKAAAAGRRWYHLAMRMVQPGYCLGFALKSAGLAGSQGDAGADHFEGDDSIEGGLPGALDHAHAPLADQVENLISGHAGMSAT